jgi:uncharacterized membrane protein YdjX (TVP38/TMEM64 family)
LTRSEQPRPPIHQGGISVAALIAGAAVILAVAAGIVWGKLRPDHMASFSLWLAQTEHGLGRSGWIFVTLLQVLVALCGIVPASLGAVTAGMIYGTVVGFLLCGPATLIGAVLAFWLSRSLLRKHIARIISRRPQARLLDEAVARDGWKLVCLLRISPVMPFAITSYALGLTSLGLRPYLLGTLAAMPALFLYALMGDLTGNSFASFSDAKAAPIKWMIIAAAIVATIMLTLRLGKILNWAFRLQPSCEQEHGK